MIDILLTVAVTAILTGGGTVLMFHMKVHRREEIMRELTVFRERVNALRTAFQTANRYKFKADNVIAEVNRLDLDAQTLFEAMRWPWVSAAKRQHIRQAYTAFKVTFDAAEWADLREAEPNNLCKSRELAELLSALLRQLF